MTELTKVLNKLERLERFLYPKEFGIETMENLTGFDKRKIHRLCKLHGIGKKQGRWRFTLNDVDKIKKL